MSGVFRGILGATFILAVALPLRADDADSAKAIVDKAIKATGSEDKLSKLRVISMKLKGTLHEGDMNISLTGEFTSQGGDKTRAIVHAEINGQAFTITEVLNRDKGWRNDQEATQEMSADELKEAQQGAYESWLTHPNSAQGQGR